MKVLCLFALFAASASASQFASLNLNHLRKGYPGTMPDAADMDGCEAKVAGACPANMVEDDGSICTGDAGRPCRLDTTNMKDSVFVVHVTKADAAPANYPDANTLGGTIATAIWTSLDTTICAPHAGDTDKCEMHGCIHDQGDCFLALPPSTVSFTKTAGKLEYIVTTKVASQYVNIAEQTVIAAESQVQQYVDEDLPYATTACLAANTNSTTCEEAGCTFVTNTTAADSCVMLGLTVTDILMQETSQYDGAGSMVSEIDEIIAGVEGHLTDLVATHHATMTFCEKERVRMRGSLGNTLAWAGGADDTDYLAELQEKLNSAQADKASAELANTTALDKIEDAQSKIKNEVDEKKNRADHCAKRMAKFEKDSKEFKQAVQALKSAVKELETRSDVTAMLQGSVKEAMMMVQKLPTEAQPASFVQVHSGLDQATLSQAVYDAISNIQEQDKKLNKEWSDMKLTCAKAEIESNKVIENKNNIDSEQRLKQKQSLADIAKAEAEISQAKADIRQAVMYYNKELWGYACTGKSGAGEDTHEAISNFTALMDGVNGTSTLEYDSSVDCSWDYGFKFDEKDASGADIADPVIVQGNSAEDLNHPSTCFKQDWSYWKHRGALEDELKQLKHARTMLINLFGQGTGAVAFVQIGQRSKSASGAVDRVVKYLQHHSEQGDQLSLLASEISQKAGDFEQVKAFIAKLITSLQHQLDETTMSLGGCAQKSKTATQELNLRSQEAATADAALSSESAEFALKVAEHKRLNKLITTTTDNLSDENTAYSAAQAQMASDHAAAKIWSQKLQDIYHHLNTQMENAGFTFVQLEAIKKPEFAFVQQAPEDYPWLPSAADYPNMAGFPFPNLGTTDAHNRVGLNALMTLIQSSIDTLTDQVENFQKNSRDAQLMHNEKVASLTAVKEGAEEKRRHLIARLVDMESCTPSTDASGNPVCPDGYGSGLVDVCEDLNTGDAENCIQPKEACEQKVGQCSWKANFGHGSMKEQDTQKASAKSAMSSATAVQASVTAECATPAVDTEKIKADTRAQIERLEDAKAILASDE